MYIFLFILLYGVAAQTKIGPEFQVNNYTTNDQNYPSISSLNNGNFVITWNSNRQDGSGYGIYAQIFSPYILVKSKTLNQSCSKSIATSNTRTNMDTLTNDHTNTLSKSLTNSHEKMNTPMRTHTNDYTKNNINSMTKSLSISYTTLSRTSSISPKKHHINLTITLENPILSVPSKGIARTMDMTASISSVLSVNNPSMASQGNRLKTLRSIINCQQNKEIQELDWTANPTRMSIGSGIGAGYAGSIIGNIIISVGFCIIVISISYGYMKFRQIEWSSAIAWARFPAVVSFPIAFFSGSIPASIIVSITMAPPDISSIVASFGSLYIIIPSFIAIYLFLYNFRNTFKSETNNETEITLKNFFSSSTEWSGERDKIRQFGLFFDGYTDKMFWFFLVEILWVNVCGGFSSSLNNYIKCVGTAWITFSIYMIYLGLLIRFRPYNVPFELIGQTIVAIFQTLALLITAINVSSENSDKIKEVAETLATIVSGFITIISFVDLIKAIYMKICRKSEDEEIALDIELLRRDKSNDEICDRTSLPMETRSYQQVMSNPLRRF